MRSALASRRSAQIIDGLLVDVNMPAEASQIWGSMLEMVARSADVRLSAPSAKEFQGKADTTRLFRQDS